MPQNTFAHFIRLVARRSIEALTASRRYFHFYNFQTTPRRHWLIVAGALLLIATAGVFIPRGAIATHDEPTIALTSVPLPIPPLQDNGAPAPDVDAAAADGDWITVRVARGQTVGDIFRQQGFSANDLQSLLNEKADAPALRNIHPGDEFSFLRNPDGSLAGVRFDRDDHTRVTAHFGNDRLQEQVENRQVEHRIFVAHGIIESSLFGAGEQAGMSDAMVLKLANAFGYDIDFAQDLRVGDNFTVIYEVVYCEGERLRDGDIVAATFVNHGKRFSAFRYTDLGGTTMFYSDDGRPLRKSFLRTPLEFSRISSYFTAGRMHPILGTMRAHQGVDYAAPMGTPIHAAGDGKVAFRGWQGGYGNVVILQHGGHYSTLYGHMSHIAGIHQGQHVEQGQTIGYVGMTGLATGPHLHYEFRVDGVHRNPLTVTLPKPEPLPATELARFQHQTTPLLAKLKTLEATQFALAKK